MNFHLAPLLIALSLLSGCTSTTEGGAVGASRPQLLLVSSQELDQMAVQAYTKLTSEAAAKGALNTDAAMLARVRAVAARLEPKTAVFRGDAPSWKWEVNLIESDQLNAFCMPGGKIMFYTGLVRKLNLTDEEIAVVMGHEIAHALREHSREQVSQAAAAQTVIGLGTQLLGLGSGTAQLTGTAYQALVATNFSRAHEAEADRIGLELMARAGYNPQAGVSLWQKMGTAGNTGGTPDFLSTHPSDSSRVQQIQALLPTVMPLYQAARR
ncbi:M48 family metallopeptidase [Polaromonas sp. UC242_47]|uniref:M48 family metallopeptidase n=1 Tax=Polaromonas sp. UC242_47 TaxID=3374626 RepID=UPI0037A4C6C4